MSINDLLNRAEADDSEARAMAWREYQRILKNCDNTESADAATATRLRECARVLGRTSFIRSDAQTIAGLASSRRTIEKLAVELPARRKQLDVETQRLRAEWDRFFQKHKPAADALQAAESKFSADQHFLIALRATESVECQRLTHIEQEVCL